LTGYRIVPNARAWWPVTFPGVTEEGEVVTNKIELRFQLHTEDEHVALLTEAAALPEKARQAADAAKAETDEKRKELERTMLSGFYADFVQRLAVDWRGVAAENGDTLKWEPENIRLLMNQPGGIFQACVRAYVACRAGEKDVRSGN
jgi:hypothetical protein